MISFKYFQIFIFGLFWGQVIRGVHTSGVIWFYFLLLVLCGVPPLHGHIHWHPPPTYEWILYCCQYSVTIITFVVTCFADRLPENEKRKTSKECCPKESASFVSRLLFSWFTSTAILGWKKPLTVSDLWQIRDGDKSCAIHSQFNDNWESLKGKGSRSPTINSEIISDTWINGSENGSKKYKINGNNSIKRQTSQSSTKGSEKPKTGILRTICKTFWFYFLTGALFRLINDILTFINPQIMK